MIVLGVDGGLSGGLTLIESGERRRIVWSGDIPVMGEGAKKRVHVRGVIAVLQRYKIGHAFMERGQAMPVRDDEGVRRFAQGASSAFNYGRAIGALEAAVEGMLIPLTLIEPAVWKRAHGLLKPAGMGSKEWQKVVKENSRQRAILLYPECPFWPLKKHHGRAEAALIADYGLSKRSLPHGNSASQCPPKDGRSPSAAITQQ